MSGRRNRSAVACQACRRRKVRCTVTVTGIPCINCSQDGLECTVVQRRGTQQTRNQPLREIRAFPHPRSSPRRNDRTSQVGSGETVGGRTVSNLARDMSQSGRAVSEPTAATGTTTPYSEQSRIEDEERSAADFATASLAPRDAEANDMPIYTGLLACMTQCIRRQLTVVGESLGFSAVLDVLATHAVPRHVFRPSSHPSLTAQDVEYLKFKGCLTLPSSDICRELLRAYFHHVHPILPVVDAAQVLKFEQQHDRPAEWNLLLLWSIFFVAVNFIPAETCTVAGYSSRKEMKEAMYSRAKCMYNNGGDDKITQMQSALLLGFWHSEMNNHAQPWYWTGIAINLGQIMGLHRDPDAVKFNPSITGRRRALWRRLWWSCFFRDRWLGLTLGRPLRINLLDCDLPMPSTADVMSDLSEVSPSVASLFIPEDLAQLSEYWILLLRLSKILGDALTLSYQPKRPNPTIEQVEAIESELLTLEIPHECASDQTECARFAVYHLQLHYQLTTRRAFLITFYRPFTNRLPEGVPSINQTIYQSAVRAKVDAAALQTNTILDALAREKLLNFAGPMTPPLLVPAMHIHLLNCKSDDPLTRQLSLNKLDFCMLILKVMQDVHTAASYYRGIFSEAIRHLSSTTSKPTGQGPVVVETPASLPGEPTMETLLSGDFLDGLMDEASFFNFWEPLSNM
ncbi:putative C6 transcription factor [Aspergillus fumigatus]|uniref:C6 transcription factor, putative n=1 Tax=Aspergillus fumigatus (strain CBS 144.89 / FGSC A1163 / CEA10) TaxID=451804 RepID=B0Y0K4_ASPFC|nr:C6 transcription factor, putative [Aspergillus fumigatus A1163]KMK59641.1 C6 transcription factor, putative [Aspergillus fumigatus Z5]